MRQRQADVFIEPNERKSSAIATHGVVNAGAVLNCCAKGGDSQMKTRFQLTAAVLWAAALTGCSTSTLQVAEVGSYHVGGRAVTLSGLPEKELVFTPGAPPLKLNPNGDFEVESLYARYTLLANPKGRYPLLMWHGGGLSGVT